MGQDARMMDALARVPHGAADPAAHDACPKPEHTGALFGRHWPAGPTPAGGLATHPEWVASMPSPAQLPSSYWSAFHDRASTGIGGGAYPRVLSQPAGARLYRVRKSGADGEPATITQALAQWNLDKRSIAGPLAAVIELDDSGTYHEAPAFLLEPGEYLQLRAAHMARPVLRCAHGEQAGGHGLVVRGGAGSRFVLDGVLLTGGALDIASAHSCAQRAPGGPGFSVRLRHSTLVPGWDPDSMRRTPWRGPASIALHGAALALHIEHCVLGPVRVMDRVTAGTVSAQVLQLHVGDSIIDGGHEAALAISDATYGPALASADFCRVTVIGALQLYQMGWAENSVFLGAVLVAQPGAGCLSYCYLAPGSRTPLRTHCQPELAQWQGADAEREALRVRPRYVSLRYGAPGYARLAPDCAPEITCGADDGSALGAFHHQQDQHQHQQQHQQRQAGAVATASPGQPLARS